ncbi:FecCD family ABC transporter permease [Embleya sp. NPDC020886]|uniref:FecCD family ABC transporter permease n=1 Tax=Embleya sp. NPDC020886 TaxID=3363980 RepID=UPI0037A95125
MRNVVPAPTGNTPVDPTAARPRPSAARRTAGPLSGIALLLVVVACSVALGSKTLTPAQTWHALVHDTGPARTLVWEVRIPRTLVGLAVGAALGAAGALIQALTRNPLADPGILGVSTGASFAVTLSITFTGATGLSSYLWFAFLGAAVVTAMVYLLGATGRAGANPARLLLVGVALTAVLTGIQTGITLLNPRALDGMRAWAAGSLAGVGTTEVARVAPFLLFALVIALRVAGPLNMLAMGEDLSRALGTHIALVRVSSVIAITLLAGGATALVGPIALLGLMVPHICRRLVGADQRRLLPGCLLAGPILLLGADVLARLVVWPGELPVGVVMAFLGSPMLIALSRARRMGVS